MVITEREGSLRALQHFGTLSPSGFACQLVSLSASYDLVWRSLVINVESILLISCVL
jgi:hypothetical protein